MKMGDYLDRDVVDQLAQKCWELAGEMFQDGEIPVEIIVIDRTRYESLCTMPVPYHHKAVETNQQAERFSLLVHNLSQAAESVERFIRLLQTSEVSFAEISQPPPQDGAKYFSATDQHLAEENRQLLERNAKVEQHLRELRSERAHQIRKDQAVEDARSRRNHAHDALEKIIDLLSDKPDELSHLVVKIAKQGFNLPKKRKKP